MSITHVVCCSSATMQTRSSALQVVQIIPNGVERTVSSHQRPVKQTEQILK